MEVNDALLDKLADLARLEIEPKEREGLKQDLQRMISFVEKLQELNTGGGGPQLHMTDAANVLRDDVVQGSVSREEGLKNAPDTDGVFFKVPKVIKKV
jgi:aspartyl-tRNA(Asn)/glutamyl-tRNA(Gln) amidotransferase subunit C